MVKNNTAMAEKTYSNKNVSCSELIIELISSNESVVYPIYLFLKRFQTVFQERFEEFKDFQTIGRIPQISFLKVDKLKDQGTQKDFAHFRLRLNFPCDSKIRHDAGGIRKTDFVRWEAKDRLGTFRDSRATGDSVNYE